LRSSIFLFNYTAPSPLYTLSLHDALPICLDFAGEDCPGQIKNLAPRGEAEHRKNVILFNSIAAQADELVEGGFGVAHGAIRAAGDRKSTRLNSSHDQISYAVFCLKKKKKI